MRRKLRLDKEVYEKLKEFKKKVRKERTGMKFKDHQGNLYEVDKNGSYRKVGVEINEPRQNSAF